MIKHKKGFTLIETIISVALIAIIMAIFMTSYAFAAKMINVAENKNRSSMQAAGTMENQAEPTEILKDRVTLITIDGKNYPVDVQIEVYKNGDVAYRKAVIQNANP